MVREIFVVDDNADYQFIFFKALKELEKPYAAKFFENAKACHQHMETLQQELASGIPALVVLDLNMPGINGLQLLKMIKTSAPKRVIARDIPIVIMSNGFTDSQVVQCYQAGANAVIQKPDDFPVLKFTIQSICNFWLDRDSHMGQDVQLYELIK